MTLSTAPTHDDARQPDPQQERLAAALREGRWAAWAPLLLAVGLIVVLLLWALAALPGLPDTVPVHWGPDGQPDRFEETSLGTVAMGPLVLLGITLPVALVAAMLPALSTVDPATRSPWGQVRFEAGIRGSRSALGWIMLLVVLFSSSGTVEVLTGNTGGSPWWLMPLLLTVLMVGLFPAMALPQRRWRHWGDATAQDLGLRPTEEELREDRRWKAMGLYDNPEDPRVLVPKREGLGTGSTLNIGSRAGRAWAIGFVVVMVVVLPGLIWLVAFAAR